MAAGAMDGVDGLGRGWLLIFDDVFKILPIFRPYCVICLL
jgi:hypothetical protein